MSKKLGELKNGDILFLGDKKYLVAGQQEDGTILLEIEPDLKYEFDFEGHRKAMQSLNEIIENEKRRVNNNESENKRIKSKG